MSSGRTLRRLVKLSQAAVVKTGAEKELIVKTILKILDECTELEYGIALTPPTRTYIEAAGVVFDDDDKEWEDQLGGSHRAARSE